MQAKNKPAPTAAERRGELDAINATVALLMKETA